MKNRQDTVLVCGAGIAGQSFAKRLRQVEPGLRILLLSMEAGQPYNRTRLSKHLALEPGMRDLGWVSAEELSDLRIEYLPETQVLSVDPRLRQCRSDAGILEWDHLVLATGARARPGRSDELCFYTMDDFEAVDKAVALALDEGRLDGRGVLIRGSGILAIELADQIRRRGVEVCIQNSGRPLMSRELPPDLGAELLALARRAGIEVAGISDPDPQDFGLRIAAVGTRPFVPAGSGEWGGIHVDFTFASALPGVYAIGDCAQLPDGTVSHLWHMAEEQGIALAEHFGRTDWVYRPNIFRAKAEVFGKLVFSGGSPGNPAESLEHTSRDLSLRAEFRSDSLCKLSYIGPLDKNLGKTMLSELRSGTSRQKLAKLLAAL